VSSTPQPTGKTWRQETREIGGIGYQEVTAKEIMSGASEVLLVFHVLMSFVFEEQVATDVMCRYKLSEKIVSYLSYRSEDAKTDSIL
jgi:hypothetical protein